MRLLAIVVSPRWLVAWFLHWIDGKNLATNQKNAPTVLNLSLWVGARGLWVGFTRGLDLLGGGSDSHVVFQSATLRWFDFFRGNLREVDCIN